jgi:hypothetical protein
MYSLTYKILNVKKKKKLIHIFNQINNKLYKSYISIYIKKLLIITKDKT